MSATKLKSYRDLEIWKMARELVVVVHKMTLEKLPKFEMYEEGSQIRRSSKSISSNIVEGYGRSRYKNDYIKFLTYALASRDETRDHIEMLYETGSLSDKDLFENLRKRYDVLGRSINNFRQRIITSFLSPDVNVRNGDE
ncbi:four helix bundle protein [candidate division KSB1 bacterium]|nr:four helix bundle protein [candidate division KSB1 bacterium]